MENSDNNIEIFNESVAIIFEELYRNFPIPISLNYNDLAIKLFKVEGEIEDHTQNIVVLESTVKWLKNSGYIWFGMIGDAKVDGAVLSPKGLEVLKVVPDSLSEKISIGDRLLGFAKNSTREVRVSLIKIALTEGYKILAS